MWPDLDGPVEDLTKCRIDGCLVRVLGDDACTEHGGRPQVEADTDIWGATIWRFDAQQEDEK